MNCICRNGKRLVLKSVLKKISYESVFFNAPNRIWIQAPVWSGIMYQIIFSNFLQNGPVRLWFYTFFLRKYFKCLKILAAVSLCIPVKSITFLRLVRSFLRKAVQLRQFYTWRYWRRQVCLVLDHCYTSCKVGSRAEYWKSFS